MSKHKSDWRWRMGGIVYLQTSNHIIGTSSTQIVPSNDEQTQIIHESLPGISEFLFYFVNSILSSQWISASLSWWRDDDDVQGWQLLTWLSVSLTWQLSICSQFVVCSIGPFTVWDSKNSLPTKPLMDTSINMIITICGRLPGLPSIFH